MKILILLFASVLLLTNFTSCSKLSKQKKVVILPKEESYQKVWINAYGIFGFGKGYVENKNLILTTPKLNRKADLGSYIGCTYRLNEKLFKDGENSLNIFVEVEVTDYNGKIILKDKWPDIAFKDKKNNAALFKVEKGELLEGYWKFTITHKGEELFSQTIPVMIEKY